MNRETVIPTGIRIGGSESDSVTVEPFVRALGSNRVRIVRALGSVLRFRFVLLIPKVVASTENQKGSRQVKI